MKHFIQSSRQKRKVLVVDDEVINRELLEAILALNYEVYCAANGSEAMKLLRTEKEPFSLILLDLLMPCMGGFQVLEECKSDEILKKIPIIVMTSEKSAEVRSIRMGADDFIPKPYRMPEVILARCERIIELSEEKTLINSIETDETTGLCDKAFYYAYIERTLSSARFRTDALTIRVENYRRLKKMLGQARLNLALKKIAGLISRELIGKKGIASYSGDGVFSAYCKHRDDYEAVFEQIQDELSAFAPSKGVRLRAGINENVDKASPMESWFAGADSACDSVCPPNRTALYTAELRERDMRREHLARDFKELSDDQIAVRFQPRYRIKNGSPVPAGAYAVPCWRHPLLGLLSAEEFLPIALEEGQLFRIDRIVLREAAAAAKRLRLPVAVSVSCADGFEDAAREFSVKSSQIIPAINELTECAEKLKNAGFSVEFDGFGARGVPLEKLARAHAAAIKLDDGLSGEGLAVALGAARLMGAETIVGGVETGEQLEALIKLGCDYVQGNYLCPLLTAEELINKIR